MRTTAEEGLSASNEYSVLDAPRVLSREWKASRPYLPKSSSLPAFQLRPRARPIFTCTRCGFANFFNIPLCVWCAAATPEAIQAFERTIPRPRTASAPPRVFWTPNELSFRARRASGVKRSVVWHPGRPFKSPAEFRRHGHYRAPSAPVIVDQVVDTFCAEPRGRQSLSDAPVYGLKGLRQGRPQAHKRSHSTPHAVYFGHPKRPPIYSMIRPHTASSASSPTSDTRISATTAPRARRPASPAPSSPSAFHSRSLHSPVPASDEGEEDYFDPNPFAFVKSEAAAAYPPDEALVRAPQRTLSARISRGLASPVSALCSMHRAVEMRTALAALARESAGGDQTSDARNHGLFAARLGKLRRVLKRLVRRKRC
ncbi:hypothetical protein GGX14DRAFT_586133 [Mycena pura]|uniref:Uncharacterized protein n=1 Tax=Mycena pura TaxID=153505 RepID=A0AAD6VQY9_9AGAR|nr:hypothetical protein GGX14DRAFT_586133 [Mycena pura]